MFTGTGATKSFTSEVNEDEERLFRKMEPSAEQVPGGKTPAAVRSMEVSPKVFPISDCGAFGFMGSVTVPELTAASAEGEVPEVRSLRSPQQGSVLELKQLLAEFGELVYGSVPPTASHRRSPMSGVPLPLKSKVTSS